MVSFIASETRLFNTIHGPFFLNQGTKFIVRWTLGGHLLSGPNRHYHRKATMELLLSVSVDTGPVLPTHRNSMSHCAIPSPVQPPSPISVPWTFTQLIQPSDTLPQHMPGVPHVKNRAHRLCGLPKYSWHQRRCQNY